jgi:hypothetical protein
VSDEIWIKTQAWTTQAEIDALNALLNLDLREGPDVRVAADD